MRLFPRLYLALVFVVACLSPAGAVQRVALVVGNSDYKLISPLANPENDAALMAETLRAVGFEVIETKNADQKTMKRAIRNFGRRLEAAGKDGVGLFYYAGHAVEARGVNYLIPLDAPIARDGDLDIEAVSAQWVLTQMEIAGNGLNVVILDACRNNPYKGSFRSAGRGLAKMAAPTGSYIAYAAAPGKLASDGSGSNSLYTATLAKAIREPGLKLEDTFKRVRVRVHEHSGGKQTPWEEGSVLGDFYFVAPESSITVNVQPEPSPPTPAQPAFDARSLDLAFWNSIKDSVEWRDFQAYLNRYGEDGEFNALASLRRDRLKGKSEEQTAALTPPSQPAEEPAFTVTEMDETYYAVKRSNLRAGPGTVFAQVGRTGKMAVGLAPPKGSTETQKTEWNIGVIVALADECGYRRQANKVHAYMKRSPYYKRGRSDVNNIPNLIAERCGQRLSNLQNVLGFKEDWENYIDATYPEPPAKLSTEELG